MKDFMGLFEYETLDNLFNPKKGLCFCNAVLYNRFGDFSPGTRCERIFFDYNNNVIIIRNREKEGLVEHRFYLDSPSIDMCESVLVDESMPVIY